MDSDRDFNTKYQAIVDKDSTEIIVVTRILTPLGPMIAGVIDRRVCILYFADCPTLEPQLKHIATSFNAQIVSGHHHYLDRVHQEIAQYFAGARREFTVPIAVKGTPFQEKVWQTLRTIPYGTTCSYKEQAASAGNPTSVRAVAKTNGDNRISIIIPCHRVIGSDGTLTGYGGGLWRKKYLLDLEAKHYKT
jgi:AraC family transcriptional regulator of adaptative response/methylated-DNA-[protein]-cysteine methyltransferase